MVPGEFGTLIARFHFGEGVTLDVRMSGSDLRAGSDTIPPERILAWDRSGHLEWVSDGAKSMFANANAALVDREVNRRVGPPEADISQSREASLSLDSSGLDGHAPTGQSRECTGEGSPSESAESAELKWYPFFVAGLLVLMGFVIFIVYGATLETRASAQKLFEATGDVALLPPVSLWSIFGPMLFTYLMLAATLVLGPLVFKRLENAGDDVACAVADDTDLAKLTVTCLVVASSYLLVSTALVGFLAPAVYSGWFNVAGFVLFILVPCGAGYWRDRALGPQAVGPIQPPSASWVHWPQDGWALAVGYGIPFGVALALFVPPKIGYGYGIPMSKDLRLAILLIVPFICQVIGGLLATRTLSALLQVARGAGGRAR